MSGHAQQAFLGSLARRIPSTWRVRSDIQKTLKDDMMECS